VAAAEGGAAAAEGGAAGAAEGGAAAAGEVSSGAAEGGAATASTTSWSTSAANFGIQVAASTVQSVGTSGLQYDIENGRDFTAAGFFESLGWGALSGALGGALGQIPGLGEAAEMLGAGALAKFGINMVENGVEGAGVAAFTQESTNIAHHDPWYQGLLEATLVGFGESAVLGGLTEGLGSHAELKTDLQAKIGEESVQGLSTMVDRVLATAKGQDGLMMYGTASFFIVTGYTLWGAEDWYANHWN
jgi:hypothetical protein